MQTVRTALALIVCGTFCGVGLLAGCAHDEPVGHSKTTTKQTTSTPSGSTTVTETKEKNTTVYPK
jgi:hypothetical protein